MFVETKPMVKICAHRGLWDENTAQNSIAACKRAEDANFALEVDLIEWNQTTWVSHDGPDQDPAAYPLEELLTEISEETVVFWDMKGNHSLEVISSLLAPKENHYFNNLGVENYQAFSKEGYQCLVSLNESTDLERVTEKTPLLIDYLSSRELLSYLEIPVHQGRLEFFISREIFSQAPVFLWDKLKDRPGNKIFICTDLWEQCAPLFS